MHDLILLSQECLWTETIGEAVHHILRHFLHYVSVEHFVDALTVSFQPLECLAVWVIVSR